MSNTRDGAKRTDTPNSAGSGTSDVLSHSHRLRLSVRIRHRETHGIIRYEARVGHTERPGDELTDGLRQRLARCALKGGAKHVDGERIAPGAPRRKYKRRSGEPPQILAEIESDAVDPVGNSKPVIQGPGLFRQRVAETCCMG